jgi:hypothetical protein
MLLHCTYSCWSPFQVLHWPLLWAWQISAKFGHEGTPMPLHIISPLHIICMTPFTNLFRSFLTAIPVGFHAPPLSALPHAHQLPEQGRVLVVCAFF